MAGTMSEKAQLTMVECQVRTWGVLDARVLEVMRRLPREEFVPPGYRNLAFNDMEIPLAHQEVMMAPKVTGRMLQALNIQPRDQVLEVGTGTGYTTALLALLAPEGQIYSVDIHPDFTTTARQRLAAHNLHHVCLETGNAVNGWEGHEPYDAIAITGSLPVLTDNFQNFRDSLRVGGRLFVIVGEVPTMEALLITRVGETSWTQESLFETVLPPLLHAPRSRRFAL